MQLGQSAARTKTKDAEQVCVRQADDSGSKLLSCGMFLSRPGVRGVRRDFPGCLEIEFWNVSAGGYNVVSAKDWRRVAERRSQRTVLAGANSAQNER